MLDPDEVPVQYYPPTDGFDVSSSVPKNHSLPETKSSGSHEHDDFDYNYDYKALSDADEEEWSVQNERDRSARPFVARDEINVQMHPSFVCGEIQELPHCFTQPWQFVPFGTPGLAPVAYAMGQYPYYPVSRGAHLTQSSAPLLPYWHGGVSSLYSMPSMSPLSRIDKDSLQPTLSPVLGTVAPTLLLQYPETPPPTPPTRPRDALPPPPVPPFIVGTVTDAYLRMEAARRRHMRERARRRARPLYRDTLPARSMALTDFVVGKRHQKVHFKGIDTSEGEESDSWSSLPFASDDPDTKLDTEDERGEHARALNNVEATCRFPCRLDTLT